MGTFSVRRRPGVLLAVCLALFLAVLASQPLVALASPLASSASQPLVGPRGKQIDWAHPMRVQLMPTHSGLEADVPPTLVPLYVPPTTGLQPQANFPSTCYHNTAYYVGVGGVYSWSHTTHQYTAHAWYMWCPTYAGDPIGINWSQGHINVTGCGHIEVGEDNITYGALIYDAYNFQTLDGESPTTYSICNSYVWDDSLTIRGDGRYGVYMSGWLPDVNDLVGVGSPCCF